MKVLVVSSLYERADRLTGQVVHQQCLALTRAGVDLRVVCPMARAKRGLSVRRSLAALTRRAKSKTVDGIRVEYIPYFNWPHGVAPKRDARSLERTVARAANRIDFSPEIVHAHYLFPTAFACQGLARRMGIPLVATAHGSDVHTNPGRNSAIRSSTEQVLREADIVLAVSSSLADDAVALCGSSCRPTVAYLGVNTDEFVPVQEKGEIRARLGLPRSGTGYCCVSRLAQAKGVDRLVDAFCRVANDDPSSWLALVGDGPARPEVEQSIRSRGMERRIFLAGPQPHAEVPRWLQAADVFVLASRNEGLPNSILEAMSCGLPVVATDVGGISEAVTAECGFVVPVDDISCLVSAMRTLGDNPDLALSQGSASRNRVERLFSWSASASKVKELYEQVLRRRRQESA